MWELEGFCMGVFHWVLQGVLKGMCWGFAGVQAGLEAWGVAVVRGV